MSWSGGSWDPWREEGVCAALFIHPLNAVFPSATALGALQGTGTQGVLGREWRGSQAMNEPHTLQAVRLQIILKEATEQSNLQAGQSGRAAWGGSI